MIDQEAENATASVRHLLIQRGVDARNWQAQAEQHEVTLQALRKELAALEQERTDLRTAAVLAITAGRQSEARVAALHAVLADLLTGAEQQSQSHIDVAVKCRAALSGAEARP